MNAQQGVLAGVIDTGARPLANGRHEGFARSCLSLSLAAAYREHYPASRHWKAPSVQCEASKLHTKVLQRVLWLKAQAAHEEIVSLIEVKKLLSGIIRDGSEPTMVRLAGVDRLAKIERWDAAGPDRQQTQVFFKFTNEKGESLI